ncbi:unnamed protein product [Thlaspi arvense]|uniref:Mediator of RNA polymerase II transcription subunit 25 n=1 Tax=Thlaspi arvense TaxID=13288 RepID=A0AAU9T872_THLAR|nr:unnamed protein product [Thlaspi arvense]
MQTQISNQGPSLPMSMSATQALPRQQLLSQNLQNSIGANGVQTSAALTSALPPVGGLPQTSMPSVVGQNSNLQNMQSLSGVSQNPVGNSMGPGSLLICLPMLKGRCQQGNKLFLNNNNNNNNNSLKMHSITFTSNNYNSSL